MGIFVTAILLSGASSQARAGFLFAAFCHALGLDHDNADLSRPHLLELFKVIRVCLGAVIELPARTQQDLDLDLNGAVSQILTPQDEALSLRVGTREWAYFCRNNALFRAVIEVFDHARGACATPPARPNSSRSRSKRGRAAVAQPSPQPPPPPPSPVTFVVPETKSPGQRTKKEKVSPEAGRGFPSMYATQPGTG